MATGGSYHPGGPYTISTDDGPTLTILRALPDSSSGAFAVALNGGADNGSGSRKAAATWFNVDVATYRQACALGGIPDDQKLSDSTQGSERR